MFRFLFLGVFIFLATGPALAQVVKDSLPALPTDTVPQSPPPVSVDRDTVHQRPVVHRVKEDSSRVVVTSDSVSMRPPVRTTWEINESIPLAVQITGRHPYFKFGEKAVTVQSVRKKVHGKEIIFYVLMGLLLVFALLKQSFGKYFNDLFRVFFRTTLKQRQIREQLMQNPFSSLVFNIFFVASTGLYINFMLHYFGLLPGHAPGLIQFHGSGPAPGPRKGLPPDFAQGINFWILYLYCCIGLAVIYFGKFVGLKIMGWLFNMKKAADSYTFIVFIINKVIGIFLLPFLVLLAFAEEPLYSISLVLSWCGIGALLLYRFILGFGAIRNEVRFNLFHFFLYLCAFEITPLLLIYKLLLLVF